MTNAVAVAVLPDEIGQLATLTRLYLNENNLEALPDSISGLAELEDLYVADNKLAGFPDGFTGEGGCPMLNKLHAPRNNIAALPRTLPASIELLYLSSNAVTTVPPGLLQGLPKLKFLHLKDNELSADGLAFDELDTDPARCQLRVFEVDGNPELVAAAPDKIAQVVARLVKSWTFASGAGNGAGSGSGGGDAAVVKPAVPGTRSGDVNVITVVDLSSSKFGGAINVSDQTTDKAANPPGTQTASL